MRLLIVEDEPTLVEQLAEALAEAGYAVDVATDGEDAAYRGATEPYDAVVLDLGLPRLDGLSVLRGWRAEAVAVPVLVLTARGEWHEKVDGIDAGADDYLAKPFRMEELLAAAAGAHPARQRRRLGGDRARRRDPGHAQRPGQRGRPTDSVDRPRVPGAVVSRRTTPGRWSHAANSSSISTPRTTIATPTPSRSSSGGCAAVLGVAAIVTERGFGYRFVDAAGPVD